MHKTYFTTLLQKFMPNIANIDLKYLDIYHIACLAVIFSLILLYVF